MRLNPLNLLLALLLLAAPVAAGCSGDTGDDDSSQSGDDDGSPSGDDDGTGDDDSPSGDDDDGSPGDDDDDGSPGDDDDDSSPGDDDEDGDGFNAPEDCDDSDPDVNPDANETCNEIDDNCDGDTDEGVTDTFYADADDDTYGDPDDSIEACSAPSGYVSDDNDCDDSEAGINPGADEVCDGADNDCNESIDEGVENTYYLDADDDGDGDADTTIAGCEVPNGYSETLTDCDDADPEVYGGAEETCDEKDNDCDGDVDEEVEKTWYPDNDKDGYGDSSGEGITSCETPPGTSDQGGDCDDNDPSVNPGVQETCDSKDNDCDGEVDDNAGDEYYPDADGDKYGDETATPTRKCEPGEADVADHSDCNDKDKTIFPGAAEDGGSSNNFPDGKDNDCDGDIDEGTVDMSIYDIRGGSVGPGAAIALQGVVAITGLTETFLGFNNVQSVGFFVNEPEGGEFAGMLVQLPATLAASVTVEPRDLVTVTGVYQVSNGNPSIVVKEADDIWTTGEADVPATIPYIDACAAAEGEEYAAMRVEVEDISADVVRNTGFTYDDCLDVSTALFFTEADDPDYLEGQVLYSVSGVLFARGSVFDIELTAEEDVDEALFSYVEPGGDTYSAPVTVTFQATDPAATIYYTTDGTDPTTSSSSKKVGESITVGLAPTTLRFFAATAEETEPGEIHEESYRFGRLTNPHLLITEVVVRPTDGEYVEIYNPTDVAISLDGYYLTDDASQSTASGSATPYEYVKVVLNDSTKIKVDSSDFLVSFPKGEQILPYEFRLVAMRDNFGTIAEYAGVTPDFELSTDTDDIPNMVAVAPTKICQSSSGCPTLTNDHEMVMLFFWDGTTDLVTDVDYVLWGTAAAPEEAVVKTGVEIDGPDEDTAKSTYKPDTARASQQVVASSGHQDKQSFCRIDYTESTETNIGGNGTNGQDETSEPFDTTWDICRLVTPLF